jgi:hypothetical protein
MTYCCKALWEQAHRQCGDHPDPSDCPDVLIAAPENGAEFGIRIHDGGSSFVVIRYCPWCGAQLPRREGGERDETIADSQSLAATHLRSMVELIQRLREVPAECRDHSYSADAFGSWRMTVRCHGVPVRVSYDGREREVIVERSASRKSPYTWSRCAAIPSGADVSART